ncbi:N-acetylmuramoyl-L-alanine amidase [Magnetofaba australis]|uniref:N-acetylmuramoyl-L-alanine amidase n=1 Tax=Magnetofaba australis IT-1 TaxID=1434232 RepID=A0A1Y2K5B2_9PROT|nr:N-acetylmuramoyl-L-alanine amidase [Magnetofaba australis]OSM04874.1 putative N-acetylmuramoyl-L-alanine amidase [Magnetofaba australis IT-1]
MDFDQLDNFDPQGHMQPISRRLLLGAMAMTASGLIVPARMAEAKPRPNRITDIRMWTAPDHSRIVFDLEKPVKHTLFRLKNPDRVVLDIRNAKLAHGNSVLRISDPVVKAFRTGIPKAGVTRAVFELNQSVRPRSFVLPASGNKGPRLVVDLFRKESLDVAVARQTPERPIGSKKPNRGKSVVVIDPGHGGEDPGAVGKQGTREKDVALSVSRRLADLINGQKGMEAHLTRTGDYYVSLKNRVSIARSHDADLFISLHADAFRLRSARGMSVYALSEKGKPSPDRAIRYLEERENDADLIGGVSLDKVVDREVAGILMDLSQRDSINRGLSLGQNLLSSLKQVPGGKLHYKNVKQAGFAVLKAPDIPSVLVEMAFLSNPREEWMLRKRSYQHAIASQLFKGANRFVESSRYLA